MNHKRIYEYFSKNVPDYADRTKLYIKNKHNSIKLKLLNGEEYIFTINGKNNWKLERIR